MTPPTSTYRLQLGPDLDFAAVTALVPHLARLGVGALYLSPCFAPRSGSTHGYDVVDPTRLNHALGDERAFERLARVASDHGVGLVMDIVPNHQAACGENPWWRDLLRHGAASPHAAAFDVDWHPPWPGADDRLLLPILGARYAEALADGQLRVALGEHDFELRYYARIGRRSIPRPASVWWRTGWTRWPPSAAGVTRRCRACGPWRRRSTSCRRASPRRPTGPSGRRRR